MIINDGVGKQGVRDLRMTRQEEEECSSIRNLLREEELSVMITGSSKSR